jgi:CRP/FNR family cyclic AMP-dependent transcriptional regulator
MATACRKPSIAGGGTPFMHRKSADAREVARWKRAEWPQTSFLAELKAPVLDDFLSAGELVRFGKGDALLREGHAAADVLFLLDASVKVTAQLGTGGQALLAIRVGGDIVGEIAAMDGGNRTATVSNFGHDAAIAVRLARSELRDLLGRYPDAAITLAQAVSRKLRVATQRRIDITNCTVRVRMARAVLELAEDYGRRTDRGTFIGVNVTQMELGSLVGVGETTAQRTLRDLRNDGLIAKAGRRLLVPDVAALRTVAEVA